MGKDSELVMKGAVNYAIREIEPRNKTRSVYRDYYVLKALSAIDKLPAEKIESPQVIRDMILTLRESLNKDISEGAKEYARCKIALLYWVLGQHDLETEIDHRLPAVSIKSPEQIERAIKRLRSWGQGEQGEETVPIYTGRQVAVMLEYALGLRLEKTVPGVIRRLFDEKKIFGKPDGKNNK